jgi:hypothetical protein
MDTNHDGYVSQSEAQQGKMSPDFAAADRNNDGRLDANEFASSMDSRSAPGSSSSTGRSDPATQGRSGGTSPSDSSQRGSSSSSEDSSSSMGPSSSSGRTQ